MAQSLVREQILLTYSALTQGNGLHLETFPSDTSIPVSGGLGVGYSNTWVETNQVKQSSGLEQHGGRMLISCKPIQQAPSHVPNPIPKDQCSGSVQDQVIRAPENCKVIPEQLLLSQEWSELSALLWSPRARTKGSSWDLHLFQSSKGRSVCHWVFAPYCMCVFCGRKWERETQFTVCG